MPGTTLKAKPEAPASSKVKPKIDTVRLEKLITQCLLTDVPLSILTESYDISYKQMGLLINMTQGFERQTTKMDHTFDSFTYEAIPEDYFTIPHILPEEKHFSHEKMIELFTELEEIKSKKALIVSIDTNFIKDQIQKQKEKLASYDAEKISNIQGFINEFDTISLHRQPSPEIFLHLLAKYNLNIQEKDSLNQLYDEYLNDQNKLLKLEQELTRQQQQEKELSKLDRRYRQIRDELVIHNIKLVNWCIRRFFNGIPLPKEDAQACGLEGLSNALNLFDYKKGFHFSTYAVPAIVHTIQKNFKDLTGYKWEDYIKINAINYYRNLMKTESGTDHTPTAEELANMGLIDMSATQIRKYDEIERYGKIEPLSSVHEEPESEYPSTRRYEMPMTQEDYDIIDDYEDSVSAVSYVLGPITSAEVSDQAYSVIARRTIFEVLKTLTPREQLAIEQAFGLVDGKFRTLEETGKAFNVSRERTRQILAKALRKLRHPSRAKYLRDFADMDFADVDPMEYRPQSHIDIEKIYSDYYLLSDLNLDETTVIEKLARENRGHSGYDIEYLLKKLPLIQESIISLSCQETPLEQICFRIYDYYGTLFSVDFIINILNKNREKLPTIVQMQLDDFITKKM